jgi:hypothetical protein
MSHSCNPTNEVTHGAPGGEKTLKDTILETGAAMAQVRQLESTSTDFDRALNRSKVSVLS